MRIAIITLALLGLNHGWGHAATREWTDRKGNQMKAEFTGGVLQGKVVLKAAGNRRIYVRLSELSLDDREYIVDSLTKRNNPKDLQLLQQLMLAENQVPVIDPDAVRPNTGNGGESDLNPTNPFNPLGNRNAGMPRASGEVETEMYGLPLPSPELLGEDPVRTWTSLAGTKQEAAFERVLAPGFLRLKQANGRTGTFALVNFSKEDIEYVKLALQNDLARPVFPEGDGFQSLTPEDVAKGYRVWTDRKNVPLIGKFVSLRGKTVVFEVNGEQQEYPKLGLSETDRLWIDAEVKRRAEAAAQQAAANNNSGTGRSSFPPPSRFGGGHDEGMGNRFGMRDADRWSPGMPQYQFECRHCGRTWKENFPISECPDCKGKSFFQCRRCGHKWTRTDGSIIDHCPKCSGGSNTNRYNASSGSSSNHSNASSGSSFDSSPASAAVSSPRPKDGQGVGMTILYVCMGLGVLGCIATGLFKAFG